ncbi:MAG: PAC2 family protein [Mycobacteriales bacterium]
MSEFDGLPALRSPIVIGAFEGWNDAGDAATAVIEHLEIAWGAQPLAIIDPDDYYDFQVTRPSISMQDGVTRRIEWPTSRLTYCSPPGSERDVVLLRGLEPNMRWRGFCEELLSLFHDVAAEQVVLLGALLSDNPHTRPVPIMGSVSDANTAARLSVQLSRYEGPTGILGVLQEAASRAGLVSVSLWAQVPHYVSQPPCAKASLALIRRLEDLAEFPIPTGELPQQAQAWQETVEQLAGDDEEMAEYVRQLEDREPDPQMQETSGEAIAKEFERYLRHRDSGS